MRCLRIAPAAVLFAVLGLTASTLEARSIRWARSQDALTLDPYGQNEGPTHNLMHLLYEPLVDRDLKSGTLKPTLAVSWAVTSDPTVWEFKAECPVPQRRPVQRR